MWSLGTLNGTPVYTGIQGMGFVRSALLFLIYFKIQLFGILLQTCEVEAELIVQQCNQWADSDHGPNELTKQ